MFVKEILLALARAERKSKPLFSSFDRQSVHLCNTSVPTLSRQMYTPFTERVPMVCPTMTRDYAMNTRKRKEAQTETFRKRKCSGYSLGRTSNVKLRIFFYVITAIQVIREVINDYLHGSLNVMYGVITKGLSSSDINFFSAI